MFPKTQQSRTRRTKVVAATRTGVALLVLALPVAVPTAANARQVPEPGAEPAVPAPHVVHDSVLASCFMGRHSWPTAAVGPWPRCRVR